MATFYQSRSRSDSFPCPSVDYTAGDANSVIACAEVMTALIEIVREPWFRSCSLLYLQSRKTFLPAEDQHHMQEDLRGHRDARVIAQSLNCWGWPTKRCHSISQPPPRGIRFASEAGRLGVMYLRHYRHTGQIVELDPASGSVRKAAEIPEEHLHWGFVWHQRGRWVALWRDSQSLVFQSGKSKWRLVSQTEFRVSGTISGSSPLLRTAGHRSRFAICSVGLALRLWTQPMTQ